MTASILIDITPDLYERAEQRCRELGINPEVYAPKLLEAALERGALDARAVWTRRGERT